MFFIQYLLTTLLAGILGAAALSYILYLYSKGGFTEVSMTEIIGRFFRRIEGAVKMGMILHGVFGVLFAAAYIYILFWFRAGFFPSLFAGAGLGFLHGIVMSFMLMYLVEEHHPDEKFRKAPSVIKVGICHLSAHVGYGFVVGFVFGLSPLSGS